MSADGLKIFIAGVGGQGSLTLSRLIGEAALAAGQNVVVSEVHGMSQRGGVVESTVLIGDYKSPLIRVGDADLLVSFEPLEALRAVAYASAKTIAVVNARRTIPFSIALGQGAYPRMDEIEARLAARVKHLHIFDAQKLAEDAGSPLSLNIVLLGAVAATGLLPIPHDALRQTVREKTPPKFSAVNLKAFDLGQRAVTLLA